MRDHKGTYGIYLRMSILLAIIIVIFLFLSLPYAEVEPYRMGQGVVGIINEITLQIDKQIEPIDNVERPKPPPVVKPADNPQEGEETITSTELIENIIPIEPTGPDIETIEYRKLEVKPKPITLPMPEYPEIAKKAGIEGKTVVKMLVDTTGSVIAVEIIKSSGNQLLDESAVKSASGSKFTPGRQLSFIHT